MLLSMATVSRVNRFCDLTADVLAIRDDGVLGVRSANDHSVKSQLCLNRSENERARTTRGGGDDDNAVAGGTAWLALDTKKRSEATARPAPSKLSGPDIANRGGESTTVDERLRC